MNTLLQELKQLLIESLELEDIAPEDIGDDTPLFTDEGLGLDSIDALELGVALRKKYQLKLVKEDSQVRDHFRSLRALAEFVHAQNSATEQS